MRYMFKYFATLLLLIAACCSPQTLQQGEFTAELNGFKIHYEIHGEGPVCMVVPVAWGLSHEGLRGIYKVLEEHMTMVYFDPRGMGRSEDVRTAEDHSMAAVRDDLDALREHLSLDKVILLGWSNSGMNAMKYASANPDAVSKLILLHTIHYISPEETEEWARRYPEFVDELKVLMQKSERGEEMDSEFRKFFTEIWLPYLIHDFATHGEKIVSILNSADMSWSHNLYQQTVDMPAFDAREDLKKITAPTLIVAGRHDALPPESMEEMQEGIAGSDLVIFEESAHFSSIEEAEKFVSVVREFLNLNTFK